MVELITLDDFPLSGVTRNGVWKVTNDITGWWGRPNVKVSGGSFTNGDGGFETPVEYDSRMINISGRVISRNHDYLHQAQGLLNTLGMRGNAKLLVRGHGVTQWAIVRPRGEVLPEFKTDSYLSFQIPLEAVDPFKYGETRVVSGASGGTFDVFHRGTMPAWPVVTVTGSFPGGYEMTLNGRTVSVSKSLASGSTHTVDMRTGILRENGSRVYGGVTLAEYFTVNPGLKQSFWSNPLAGGTGTFKLSVVDTFI